jgi:hypothetical protein
MWHTEARPLPARRITVTIIGELGLAGGQYFYLATSGLLLNKIGMAANSAGLVHSIPAAGLNILAVPLAVPSGSVSGLYRSPIRSLCWGLYSCLYGGYISGLLSGRCRLASASSHITKIQLQFQLQLQLDMQLQPPNTQLQLQLQPERAVDAEQCVAHEPRGWLRSRLQNYCSCSCSWLSS